MRWGINAVVTGGKSIDGVDADNLEEAIAKAREVVDQSSPCLCHACSSECEDPEISAFDIWADEDDATIRRVEL